MSRRDASPEIGPPAIGTGKVVCRILNEQEKLAHDILKIAPIQATHAPLNAVTALACKWIQYIEHVYYIAFEGMATVLARFGP